MANGNLYLQLQTLLFSSLFIVFSTSGQSDILKATKNPPDLFRGAAISEYHAYLKHVNLHLSTDSAQELNTLGQVYLQVMDLDKAADAFKKALQIAESTGNTNAQLHSFVGLARIAGYNYEIEKQEDFCKKALNLLGRKKGHIYATIMYCYAVSYFARDSEIAERSFTLSLQHINKSSKLYPEILTFAANFYIEELQLQTADSLLDKAITLGRQLPINYYPQVETYRVKGYIESMQGDFNQSILYYDTAMSLLSDDYTRGANYLRSEIYKIKSWTMESAGRYPEALFYKKQNLKYKSAIFNSTNTKVGEAHYWLALLYRKISQPHKAELHLKQAIDIFSKNNQLEYLSQCYLSLCNLAIQKGDYNNAELLAKEALDIKSKVSTFSYVPIYAPLYISISKLLRGAPEEALEAVAKSKEEAKHIFRKGGFVPVTIAGVEAKALSDLGKNEQAISILKEALRFFEQNGIEKHLLLTRTLNTLIELKLKSKEPDDIEKLLTRAINSNSISTNTTLTLPETGDVLDLQYMITTLLHLNAWYEMSDSPEYQDQQLMILKKCGELLFDQRKKNSSLPDKISREENYSHIFEIYFKLLTGVYLQTGDEKYLEKAFVVAEQGKSSILLESLNTYKAITYSGLSDSLLNVESAIKQQLYYHKSRAISASGDSTIIQKSILEAETRYDNFTSYIEEHYPEYYSLKYNFEVLSIKEVQQNLKPAEVLIKYFNREHHLTAFVITKDTVFMRLLPAIDNLQIEAFRKTLNPDFNGQSPSQLFAAYTSAGSELYALILKPLLQNLPGGNINSLTIIPDGLISFVPFEALLTAVPEGQNGDYGNLPYLVKQFDIRYGYSATSLFKMTGIIKPVDQKILAIAPTQLPSKSETADLQPLTWNKTEVDELKKYFTSYISAGPDATESEFKTKVQGYPIIHLATHAIVNDENPLYSKLLFAPPQDTLEDGMLHTFELYNMRLNTQMVVLSACNTGYGKLQKGEGVMSLSRAFAYAGCPSIVMSHWAVDDKSTAELMKYFYGHLAEGEAKDVALRKAKLDFLNNSSPLYHHPYYWNNFVVLGDVSPVKEKYSYNYIFLTVLLCLGFGGIFLMTRRKV